MLHPSRPVIASRQIPPISWGSKLRPHSRSSEERMVKCQQADEKLKAQSTKSEPTSPTKVLEIAWWVTPPPGFLRVMACLWKDPLLEKACEVPPDPLWIAAVMEPTVVMLSASCIVKDEASGVTYRHCDHFCGASGPQWPWAGDPNQWTHHRGCHRPHMMN